MNYQTFRQIQIRAKKNGVCEVMFIGPKQFHRYSAGSVEETVHQKILPKVRIPINALIPVNDYNDV